MYLVNAISVMGRLFTLSCYFVRKTISMYQLTRLSIHGDTKLILHLEILKSNSINCEGKI